MAVGCSADTSFTANTTTFRIVLLGKVGSGKSSTANTILGREEFAVAVGFSSSTQAISIRTAFRNGRQIEVIDTPDIFERFPSDSQHFRALMPLHRRPDTIILYTITLGSRFTEEDVEAFWKCKGFFYKHLIMIGFTCGDVLECEGESIEEYIQTLPTSLTRILEDCGWNYFVFKNVALMSSRNEQARQLLEIIESKLKSPGSVNPLKPLADVRSRSSKAYAAAGGDLEYERQVFLMECYEKMVDAQKEFFKRQQSSMSKQAPVQCSEEKPKALAYGRSGSIVSHAAAGGELESERQVSLMECDEKMADTQKETFKRQQSSMSKQAPVQCPEEQPKLLACGHSISILPYLVAGGDLERERQMLLADSASYRRAGGFLGRERQMLLADSGSYRRAGGDLEREGKVPLTECDEKMADTEKETCCMQ